MFICFRHSFRTCSLKSPSICAATCRFCSNIWQRVEWTHITIRKRVNEQEYYGLQKMTLIISLRKKTYILYTLSAKFLSGGGSWAEYYQRGVWDLWQFRVLEVKKFGNHCHMSQWLNVHKSRQTEIHKKTYLNPQEFRPYTVMLVVKENVWSKI